MKAMTPRLLISFLLTLAACATGGAAQKADQKSGATAASGAPAAAATGAPGRELSPRAQRLFDEAVSAVEEQRKQPSIDWDVLERRWRRVLEAEQVPEAWFNLGVVLEHRRRPDDARAAYRRALDLEPAYSSAATNLALLDEPKDPAQAQQRWTELLRRYPDDPLPRERLAALYLAAGQREEARKLAREALVRSPQAVGAYKVLMRVALDGGNADLAQLLALKASKLDPADPEIVSFEGDVLLQQKEDAGAVAKWKKAVALQDDFLPARYALLANALGKQLWESVAEQASAILRTDPDQPRVLLALGVAYRYTGQVDKALAAYDRAEKAGAGKLPEVHLARAVAYMKAKEQCEPALAELRRYLAAAGPTAATEGPAPRLERECQQIVTAGKQAEEAAREMKAEAERAEAAKKAEAEKAAAKKAEAEKTAAEKATKKTEAKPQAVPAAAASSARPSSGGGVSPTK